MGLALLGLAQDRLQGQVVDAGFAHLRRPRRAPPEALGMLVPSDLYSPSKRSMPSFLAEHEYPDHYEVRRVRRNGSMNWDGGFIFVGEAMAGELVGVEPKYENHWHVHQRVMPMGVLHGRSRTVLPALLQSRLARFPLRPNTLSDFEDAHLQATHKRSTPFVMSSCGLVSRSPTGPYCPTS